MKNSKKEYVLGAFVYIAGTTVLFAIFLMMLSINLRGETDQHIRQTNERRILI